MAVHDSFTVGSNLVLTIEAHPVQTLAGTPYTEFRLVERDRTGAFVGYCAMGDYAFVKAALARRVREAYGDAEPLNAVTSMRPDGTTFHHSPLDTL